MFKAKLIWGRNRRLVGIKIKVKRRWRAVAKPMGNWILVYPPPSWRIWKTVLILRNLSMQMLAGKSVPSKLLIQMHSNYQIRSYSPNVIMISAALVIPYNYYAITRNQATPHNFWAISTTSSKQNNNNKRASKPWSGP